MKTHREVFSVVATPVFGTSTVVMSENTSVNPEKSRSASAKNLSPSPPNDERTHEMAHSCAFGLQAMRAPDRGEDRGGAVEHDRRGQRIDDDREAGRCAPLAVDAELDVLAVARRGERQRVAAGIDGGRPAVAQRAAAGSIGQDEVAMRVE
jgi:hypothetical protein